MDVVARELAMAFLERGSLLLEDCMVTPLQYSVADDIIAKWDEAKLYITCNISSVNKVKIVLALNAILEAYDCGVMISPLSRNKKKGALYFVDMGTKEQGELISGLWYYISKKGIVQAE